MQRPGHRLLVASDPSAAARLAADRIAVGIHEAIAARGWASLALSGGTTIGLLLDALVAETIEWDRVHVLQVDERVAPDGDPDRNLSALHMRLVDVLSLPADHVHPIPVSDSATPVAPETAAADYERALQTLLAPTGGRLDVVHLGLGDDGHTASLVPGDHALTVTDRLATATAEYRGRRRVTLTYPALDAARTLVWLAAGTAKATMVKKLAACDRTIPAGRVRPRGRSELVVDAAAAALATTTTA